MVVSQVAFIDRITSTYVENTPYEQPTSRDLQDHLHIRGEHLNFYSLLIALAGSPPHTWRTLKGRNGGKN